ncbi:PriCT-2 domain-containing protein [Pseudomonas abyssi]|uniref:PriCT-2 domain-containing protein n=1 Tax=Pseudomonas abyssi TaxID=170540 RepID=UPI003C7A0E78
MADYPDLTLDDLKSMLDRISPSCDRKTWAMIAMGIKHEFGEDGFDAWDDWSRGDSSYKKADALSAWKSCKLSGAKGTVTIAYVVKLAVENNWTRERREMTAAEKRKKREDQEARRKKREAEVLADQERAENMQQQIQVATVRLLSEFTKARGKSAYLERKQAPAFGVRFVTQPVLMVTDDKRGVCEIWTGESIGQFFRSMPSPRPDHLSFRKYGPGDILIPLADLDGAVWSHQSINGNGTKLFPKFARKQGCCLWVGRSDDMPVIALAEGYATACSVYQATQWPTIMCVDLGNMAHIARGIRERYPHAQLVIAGDDDPKANGDNPGRVQAEALALELDAVVVFPELPEQSREAA